MNTSASAVLVAAVLLPTGSFAEPKYSAWGPAVNLAMDQGVLHCGGINTAFSDVAPAITKQGLSLYFHSNRPGGEGDQDLYVARRRSVDAPWGPASNLVNINTPAAEGSPVLSRNEHWMFFNSSRPGGFGDVDLWASHRKHVHDDFAWESPINLGGGVNTEGFEGGAGYFENEEGKPQLYFGRGDPWPFPTTNPTTDIWVAELNDDGSLGTARPVPQLNSPLGDQRPSIRFDGLELFFFSNRQGSVPGADGKTPSADIWASTRKNAEDPWGEPVPVVSDPNVPDNEKVNTSAGDFAPHISPDGLTLYFTSSRPGGCGGFDIYMAKRTRREDDD